MSKLPQIVLGAILSLLVTSPTLAAPPTLPDLPEQSGIYSEPGHPEIRVRVFVHHFKDKPPVTVEAAPSCADPDSSASDGAAGWKLPNTTWVYQLNPSSVPSSVGSGNLAPISAAAFASWDSALAGDPTKPTLSRGLDTTKTRSSYDNQNIIAWGRTSGSALATTYVRYYTASGIAVDVDTIMNRKFAWSGDVCGSSAYNARDILTHEIGHWYGLDDEYATAYLDNTMYGYGSPGEIKKNTLTSGDVFGIQAIYIP